jgi:hypothetical protein
MPVGSDRRWRFSASMPVRVAGAVGAREVPGEFFTGFTRRRSRREI